MTIYNTLNTKRKILRILLTAWNPARKNSNQRPRR
ncbi:hypothetical protein FOMG_19708 [Fusarium oxysporum f. sp. melonis 26406]|uniref:Uncharacterized protein n=1 Tax=Fusarium oxysporum f. sp. melonis 26406 TaxID=1089452 RepID=W9Z4J3_FUSOX|nr:hypothetical protein FOMG_19708 [Fusarium oxysporum f. sp. melonis 26406]